MTFLRAFYAASVLIIAACTIAPIQFMAGLISPKAVRVFDRVWAWVLVHAMQIKGD